MDISTKTTDELKSLAYDQIALLERVQANLRMLNEEIARRASEALSASSVEDSKTTKKTK